VLHAPDATTQCRRLNQPSLLVIDGAPSIRCTAAISHTNSNRDDSAADDRASINWFARLKSLQVVGCLFAPAVEQRTYPILSKRSRLTAPSTALLASLRWVLSDSCNLQLMIMPRYTVLPGGLVALCWSAA
jgi:hypothetical protein